MNHLISYISMNCNAIILVFSLGLGFHAIAQPGDSDLGKVQLEVIGSFKASVEESQKLSLQPREDDTILLKMPVNYNITPKAFYTDYQPEPLKPARITKAQKEPLPRFYTKLGAGTHQTPLAEIRYGSERSRNSTYGLGYRHFSTRTGVPDLLLSNNGVSENKFNAFYGHFFSNYTLRVATQFDIERLKYYGLPDLEINGLDTISDLDPAVQRFMISGTQVELNRLRKYNIFGLSHIALKFHYLQDNFGVQESHIHIPFQFQLPSIEQKNFGIAMYFDYLDNRNSGASANDNMSFTFGFRPKLDLSNKTYQLHVGFFSYYNDYDQYTSPESTNEFFIFPELYFKYPLVEQIIEFEADLEADYRVNTLRTLSRQWLFINSDFSLANTTRISAKTGFQGVIYPGMSYKISAAYINWSNFGLFYRNPFFYQTPENVRGLDVIFTDGTQLQMKGTLFFDLTKDITAEVGTQYNYYEFVNERPWHLPNWRSHIRAKYNLNKKLSLGSEVFYVGKRTAFDQDVNPELNALLTAFTDVNFNANYMYSKNLSVQLSIENMFFSRYEHYLGYGAQRFLAMLAFTYKL